MRATGYLWGLCTVINTNRREGIVNLIIGSHSLTTKQLRSVGRANEVDKKDIRV